MAASIMYPLFHPLLSCLDSFHYSSISRLMAPGRVGGAVYTSVYPSVDLPGQDQNSSHKTKIAQNLLFIQIKGPLIR